MQDMLIDIITTVGVAGLLVILGFLARLASRYLKAKADSTENLKQKHELEMASEGLNFLSNAAGSYVTYLDKFQAGGQDKKAKAIGHLTEVANNHGLNVTPATMDGMVEQALNNLRVKQGLPVPDGTKPVEQKASENNNADFMNPDNNGGQHEPLKPGDVK
ncbi:phage holin (plasmid) [Apilactobacillus apisilvae]|uniref:Phage holin n=1 Tax=Apilactobacillus apisilvae TaxID=2923364 RepID=A0ABY4PJ88_9LACO|nr:phage holin [Apilactobacillus apisilvae]UQS85829.1 phage holin [Apilactobacillus apisilvae]